MLGNALINHLLKLKQAEIAALKAALEGYDIPKHDTILCVKSSGVYARPRHNPNHATPKSVGLTFGDGKLLRKGG